MTPNYSFTVKFNLTYLKFSLDLNLALKLCPLPSVSDGFKRSDTRNSFASGGFRDVSECFRCFRVSCFLSLPGSRISPPPLFLLLPFTTYYLFIRKQGNNRGKGTPSNGFRVADPNCFVGNTRKHRQHAKFNFTACVSTL